MSNFFEHSKNEQTGNSPLERSKSLLERAKKLSARSQNLLACSDKLSARVNKLIARSDKLLARAAKLLDITEKLCNQPESFRDPNKNFHDQAGKAQLQAKKAMDRAQKATARANKLSEQSKKLCDRAGKLAEQVQELIDQAEILSGQAKKTVRIKQASAPTENYLSFVLCMMLSMMCILSGCATNSEVSQTQEDNLPNIDPTQIGNVRIALVSQERQQTNVVLVNQSNSQYLIAQDFVKEQEGDDIPITALKYRAPELSYDNKTVIVILEDEVMAKLLAIFQKYNFDNFAEPCSRKDFQESNWPARDAIFAERGRDWQILVRDAKLMNEAQMPTPKAQTYRILKSYILQAHLTGFKPMQVLYNTQGSQLFQNSQQQLEQDSRKFQRK